MPLSPRQARRDRLLQLLLVAALTVVVRLPFLLHGARFFDADEAVEGLMARHVLQGQFPVYLWGQGYKGVPEVYLASLLFAVAGPGIIALKAATLVCFVAFTCLQFLFISRIFSARIAWITTTFAVVGPPSLVLWSLSANAEIVMTLLAGTVMGLGLESWTRTGRRRGLAVFGAALGFGLWVQQYIVYYVVACAVAWAVVPPARMHRLRVFVAARQLPAVARLGLSLMLAVAVGYVALGLVAFLTGGFDVSAAGLTIGLKHPQKLWRIGAGIAGLYGAGRVAAWLLMEQQRPRRPAVLSGVLAGALAAMLGAVAGYAPAIAGFLQAHLHGRLPGHLHVGGAPVSRMDVDGLSAAMGPIVRQVVPIVLGFRSPTTEWLPVSSWFAVVIALTVAMAFASFRRIQTHGTAAFFSGFFHGFFHIFIITTPLLFVASGAFIDAQSYRYLMPVYAALPVVLALGVDAIGRWNIAVGAAVMTVLIGVFAAEQGAWYRRLAPDTGSPAIVSCLEANHVRGAFADYWLSYKLTFLAGERVIVAPNNGVDRYPPFSAFVRSLQKTGAEKGTDVKACGAVLVQ